MDKEDPIVTRDRLENNAIGCRLNASGFLELMHDFEQKGLCELARAHCSIAALEYNRAIALDAEALEVEMPSRHP